MPTGEKREGREGQYEDNEEGKRKKRSCTDEVPRGARTWVEVWIVVLALDARVGAAAQEVLVDLQIALEVRKVSRAVQRSKALLVPLVHLPAVVQDMMKHVKLLVGRRKVHGGASAIVLGPEVRVAFHDLRQLLGLNIPFIPFAWIFRDPSQVIKRINDVWILSCTRTCWCCGP